MDLCEDSEAESFEAAADRLFLTYLEDPDLNQMYLSSQRNYFELSSVVPLAVILCGAILTRFNIQNLGVGYHLFSVAFAAMIFGAILFLPYIAARVVTHYTPPEQRPRLIYRVSELYLQISHKWKIEDVIGILAEITCGLCLLARVYAGQCEDTNVWRSQTCNPFADMGAVPNDQVLPAPHKLI